jgi:hypothetical protein
MRYNAVEDLELLKKWGEWLRAISDDVQSLLRSRQIFWEIQTIVDANAKLQRQPRLFNRWLATNYVVAATVGIRRQLDRDARSVSLVRLLTDLEETLKSVEETLKEEREERPDTLSRANFLKNYRAELREAGERHYDKLVGAGEKRVDAALVRSDLDRFCAAAATETVREFVNKRAAHWDEDADDPKVSLGEVDAALDILSALVDKYWRLLTGSGGTVGPKLSPEWKGVFTVPWIEPSQSRG